MNEISQNFQVQIGDIIEFDYKIACIWEDSQIQSIISKLYEDGRMTVVDYEIIPNDFYSDVLKLKVKVLQNPFPVLVLIIAIAAISTSLFLYLSLDKIYLISREVPEVITGGVSIGILALLLGGGILVYMAFK